MFNVNVSVLPFFTADDPVPFTPHWLFWMLPVPPCGNIPPVNDPAASPAVIELDGRR